MSAPIQLAVDAVVFGYHAQQLQLLLIRRKIPPFEGSWALPGGFVLPDESLEQAVSRELREETGLEINYLEQLYTFGEPDRDPRNRVVSVAYFALVNPDQFHVLAATDAAEARWFAADQLPALALHLVGVVMDVDHGRLDPGFGQRIEDVVYQRLAGHLADQAREVRPRQGARDDQREVAGHRREGRKRVILRH